MHNFFLLFFLLLRMNEFFFFVIRFQGCNMVFLLNRAIKQCRISFPSSVILLLHTHTHTDRKVFVLYWTSFRISWVFFCWFWRSTVSRHHHSSLVWKTFLLYCVSRHFRPPHTHTFLRFKKLHNWQQLLFAWVYTTGRFSSCLMAGH